MKTLRSIFVTMLALAVLTAGAQRRISCIRNIPADVSKTRGQLGYPTQDWDPQKTYRQPVVLITFSDFDFQTDDSKAYYLRLLNEPNYNEGFGLGSVADYFRDQSGGRFNLQFDVYGPFKVDEKANPDGSPNYGYNAMEKAMQELNATSHDDFSIYDWDGDGSVDQILFIAAGYTGNHISGHIWPNTAYTFFKAPGNIPVRMASISCEMWRDKSSCGIGTIIHELAHCLGLPDIYPTSSGVFSMVDEWDLMDGGNYTNKGWCPPNFSATEKMLMGWDTPIELTSSTTITDMKPVSEGGKTYIIRNSANEHEFYMLENRQQTGWDYGIPGQGLAIFHVDYDREVWSSNKVNYYKSHTRYEIFHADGKDYLVWDPANDGEDPTKYTMDNWMRSRYLSTSVYPYVDGSNVNQSLTDESDPQAAVYTANVDGQKLMSKPVTNIQMASDGTISFDFMKEPTGIHDIWMEWGKAIDGQWYDLQGRRLQSEPSEHGVYIYNKKKIIR